MRCLSIRQPWAWLICAGYKDIENRTWRIGCKPAPGMHSVNFTIPIPSRIYVHAGKIMDNESWGFIESRVPSEIRAKFHEFSFIDSLSLGAIIGEVDIVALYTSSPSPWFTGPYGFLLKNPQLYDKPIPCLGSLGFFELKLDHINETN
jgi:hypothetical protein